MPTPRDIIDAGHEVTVSREQAFRHAFVILRPDLGKEGAFAAAVALVEAHDLPFTLKTPLGDIIKLGDQHFTMSL